MLHNTPHRRCYAAEFDPPQAWELSLNLPISLEKLLLSQRECTSDWLICQAMQLCALANQTGSASLLVFACLETRNAIEQLWFEILMLVRDGEMDEAFFKKCRSRSDGYLAAIKDAEPRYRQLSRFTAVVMKTDSDAPYQGIAWDLASLKKVWHALGDYCHAQGHPVATLDSKEWIERGRALVADTFQTFSSQMIGGATALMSPDTMSPNTRSIWDRYVANEIDEEQVRQLLLLKR